MLDQICDATQINWIDCGRVFFSVRYIANLCYINRVIEFKAVSFAPNLSFVIDLVPFYFSAHSMRKYCIGVKYFGTSKTWFWIHTWVWITRFKPQNLVECWCVSRCIVRKTCCGTDYLMKWRHSDFDRNILRGMSDVALLSVLNFGPHLVNPMIIDQSNCPNCKNSQNFHQFKRIEKNHLIIVKKQNLCIHALE